MTILYFHMQVWQGGQQIGDDVTIEVDNDTLRLRLPTRTKVLQRCNSILHPGRITEAVGIPVGSEICETLAFGPREARMDEWEAQQWPSPSPSD